MVCIFMVLVFGFAYNAYAADDFLQKELRKKAQWSQAISRVSEIIESAEKNTVYTENPPKVVITISDTDTVTVTGTIARKAYEMAHHKKNMPPAEEVMAFMQQWNYYMGSTMDKKDE